jgi:hypothetical protein
VDASISKEIGDKAINGRAQRQDVSQGNSLIIDTQKQPVFPSLSDALYARNQQKAGSQPPVIHTPSDMNICNPDMDIRDPNTDIRDPDTDIRNPDTGIRDPDTNIRDPDTGVQRSQQIEGNKNIKHPIRKKGENTKDTAVRKIRSVD